MNIRTYKDSDYNSIFAWWLMQNEMPPTKDMLSTETTFILEDNDIPLVCLTLLLTNVKSLCYAEFLVGNPDYANENRKKATRLISEYVCEYAKTLGYTTILASAVNVKLKQYYTELGWTPALDNVLQLRRNL